MPVTRLKASETVYTRMSRLLDLKIGSEIDAIRLSREGISNRAYQRVAGKLGLRPDAVAAASTMRRRVASRARLNPDESERLLRLTRVYSEAAQLFDDERATLAWLTTPADFLHDGTQVTPLMLAESDTGARLVESLLRRTAHGL